MIINGITDIINGFPNRENWRKQHEKEILERKLTEDQVEECYENDYDGYYEAIDR